MPHVEHIPHNSHIGAMARTMQTAKKANQAKRKAASPSPPAPPPAVAEEERQVKRRAVAVPKQALQAIEHESHNTVSGGAHRRAICIPTHA
jgi:hypothetical protein